MTINEWSEANYNSLIQAAKNISKNANLSEELAHYAIEQLLIKPNVQEIIDSGGANFWVIRTMLNSWRSTTSAFFKIYRDNPEEISLEKWLEDHDVADDELENNEELVRFAAKELEKLYWYDKELFKIYVDNPNISAIAKETGIPRTSVGLSINRVKTHLKSRLKR